MKCFVCLNIFSFYSLSVELERVTPAIAGTSPYKSGFSVAAQQPASTDSFHAEQLNQAELILGRFCQNPTSFKEVKNTLHIF